MRAFAYERPGTLAETFALLGAHGDAARLLAGGTDLLVGVRHGAIRPGVLVDIKRVAELEPTIAADGDVVTIGATAVLADVIASSEVRTRYVALVEAASTVGSIQIRHRATLAGNVCNASPAADTAPALLIYGACVEVAGAGGRRELPVADFMLGPRRTALAAGEVVTAVRLPIPDASLGVAFARLTRRRGVDLATVSVCCSIDGAGVTRFAYGAVAPRPFLVADSTGVLADPEASEAQKDELIAELIGQAAPISDVRASREYRQAMLAVLSRRALARALDRRATV